MITPVEFLRIGLYGDIKTGKTSVGLTAPKPIVHFDLDQGFSRAEARVAYLKIHHVPVDRGLYPQDFIGYDIITKEYQIPLKWPGQNIKGMLELWDVLSGDFRVAYESPMVRTIMIDTGTVMWAVRTGAHLQRVQKTKPERANLIQIEYGPSNTDMRAMYGAAKTYGKNLIITHHVGGVYEEKWVGTGQNIRAESVRVGDTWAGFGGMGAIVDLVGRVYMDQQYPPMQTLRIETSGYSLAAEGQTLQNPTFDGILAMVNNLRAAGL